MPFARKKPSSSKKLVPSMAAFIAGSIFMWTLPSHSGVQYHKENDLDRLGSINAVGDPRDVALQTLLSTRVCGSPAVDGYAHVNASCLLASPTAKWWEQAEPEVPDLEIHIEKYADYDGLAVGWGIGNKMENVEECAEACRNHKPSKSGGPFTILPCNAFCYCTEEVCFEPDAHKHTKGDCWLKFTEAPATPEVNMRGTISEEARKRHKTAPRIVQWHAGVILPKGVHLTNGTWSPRYSWL